MQTGNGRRGLGFLQGEGSGTLHIALTCMRDTLWHLKAASRSVRLRRSPSHRSIASISRLPDDIHLLGRSGNCLEGPRLDAISLTRLRRAVNGNDRTATLMRPELLSSGGTRHERPSQYMPSGVMERNLRPIQWPGMSQVAEAVSEQEKLDAKLVCLPADERRSPHSKAVG